MHVHHLTADGVRDATPDEVPTLLAAGGDGIVWIDVPEWDEQAARLLDDVLDVHPMAVHDCAVRNRLPKMHAYEGSLFVVLLAPHLGEGGHVHHVELDRVVGPGYLVTVHGPANPAVPPDAILQDTRDVLERVRSGRFRPRTSFELSHAIVSSMTRRMERFIDALAAQVWSLEQRVTTGAYDDPEDFLDQMFRTRHGLLAVRTIAAQSAEIYRRVERVAPERIPGLDPSAVADLVDQFDRVAGLAGEEKDYLQGVIEFYRTRTDTKMTIAAERLAVIAVVTLPVTALASVLGMNLIVAHETLPWALATTVAVMAAMSGALLVWAKRQGWW